MNYFEKKNCDVLPKTNLFFVSNNFVHRLAFNCLCNGITGCLYKKE